MTDYKVQRAIMIESQLRPNRVTNPRLLQAFHRTPRELFVPPSQRPLAYMDAALRVEAARKGGAARYLLAPMVLARLIQIAAVKETDRVLDVAPATGYSTAILARLAREVVALEHDAGLAAIARDALAAEGLENVKQVTGEFAEGSPDDAPFDVILVNGRVEEAPEKLLGQLAEGGRLVAIVGGETASEARLFTKIGGSVQSVADLDAGAPLLPGFEKKPQFVF